MSGGHFKYRERAVRELAEDLQEHPSAIVAALGAHLLELADAVEQIDRSICGDSGPWDREAVVALLPVNAAANVAGARLMKASDELRDICRMQMKVSAPLPPALQEPTDG